MVTQLTRFIRVLVPQFSLGMVATTCKSHEHERSIRARRRGGLSSREHIKRFETLKAHKQLQNVIAGEGY
jgi:hypothetical protein